MAKAKEKTVELPVSYKSVTFGDKVVSVGISLSRNRDMPPNKADSILTGKRLTLKMFAGTNGDAGSATAFADGDLEIEGVFDTASLSVTDKKYGTTLSAPIKEVDGNTLKLFAKRAGRLVIAAIEEADAEEDEGDE